MPIRYAGNDNKITQGKIPIVSIMQGYNNVYGDKPVFEYLDMVFIIDNEGETAQITGLTDYGKTMEQISVPSVYKGKAVTSISGTAFNNITGLKSIVIPNSITNIGEGAFSGCSALESMTLPFIGDEAGKTSSDYPRYPFGYIFGESSYMGATEVQQYYDRSPTSATTNTDYYIPSSLRNVKITGENILRGAFYNCSMLTSITIPEGVTEIGMEAFRYCSGLTSFTIPGSVTGIGRLAFANCDNLTSLYISDLVAWCNIDLDRTSISPEHDLYLNGEIITNFVVPNSVTSLKPYFLAYCNVTSITFGNNLKNAESTAFYESNISTVYYTDNIASWVSHNWLQSLLGLPRDNGITLYIEGNKIEGSVTIPEGVTSIGDYAFAYLADITSITIPNSVKSIGDYAFCGCSGLISIVVEEGNSVYHSAGNCLIETASKTLIAGCNTSVIPNDDSVTSIRRYAFRLCAGLTSIIIPNGVTSIESYAFSGCTGLTSVIIPDSVMYIGYAAFADCTSLTSFTYEGTVTQWNAVTKESNWYHDSAFTEVVCSDGTVSV